MREFYLQRALTRARVHRKDIQNEGRTVEDLDLQRRFQIAQLRRRELIIKDQQIIRELSPFFYQFLNLTGPDVCPWVYLGQALKLAPNHLHSCRMSQLCQLIQRVLHAKGDDSPTDLRGYQKGLLGTGPSGRASLAVSQCSQRFDSRSPASCSRSLGTQIERRIYPSPCLPKAVPKVIQTPALSSTSMANSSQLTPSGTLAQT